MKKYIFLGLGFFIGYHFRYGVILAVDKLMEEGVL